MPFAGHKDHDDCVSKNSDKGDPDAYCATIRRKVEGESLQGFKRFIQTQISVLKKRAGESKDVGLLYGIPATEGKKIKGTLAYAGVSLNNRLYLPEELSKGDGMTLPLIINHASTAGIEAELYKLPMDVQNALLSGKQYKVGEVKLSWDADRLTLSYEGSISHPFFFSFFRFNSLFLSFFLHYIICWDG